MSNDRLKQLGGLYLLRTREELVLLNAELVTARQGQPQALLAVQQIAHRICGSGAMLGFKVISDAAGQIERILRRADPVPTADEWAVVMEQVQRMQTELDQRPPGSDADV